MPALFAATLFLSATLLFLVQPMIAKMLLPKLGGTPQVWNTCMVFFQALLLAGYSYAHFMTSRFGDRKQSRLHIPLMLLPFLFLLMPIGIPSWNPPEESNPIPWLLAALGIGIGLPFLIVSTSAPLLQRWFAATGHPDGHDPYFLYGASNLGSMLALLGYPTLVEPFLPLTGREDGWELPFGGYLAFDQIWVWTIGYACLVVCTAICAWVLQNSPDPAEKKAGGGRQRVAATQQTAPLTPQQRLRWVMLAFVPSSLMLGATTYLTTDIAAIPLLWVIPLALYLLTFIIVFWKYPNWLHRIFILALPVLILLLVFMMLSGVQPRQMWLRILWHLVGFFAAAMVCHGELARSRPPAGQLTEFYLWMSFGGVLGGLFNGIVAPLVFNTLAEYAIVMVVACLLVPPLDPDRQQAIRPVLDLASLNILAVMGVVLLVFRLAKAPEGQNLYFAGLLTATKPGLLVALAGLAIAGLTFYVLSNPEQRINRLMDLGLATALGVLVVGLLYGLQWTGILKAINSWIENWYESTKEDPDTWFKGLRNYVFLERGRVRLILTYGVPAILCYTFVERPVRFGLGVAAILLVGSTATLLDDDVLLRERSFFGVLRVEKGQADPEQRLEAVHFYGQDRHVEYHELLHGTTLHGKQRIVSPDNLMERFLVPLSATNTLELAGAWAAAHERWVDPRREPLTYYHPTGPIGQIMSWFKKDNRKPNLAVIGLGTGTMASHCESGQLLHYYDIDPAVVAIAQDPKYFTYVPHARERGVDVEMILGDARIAMEKQNREKPDVKYGLIVVDAFTSDAIPIHLITREAVKVYLSKLSDDGIIAFHISNRHLRLKPVLANIADHLQLAGIGQYDVDEKAIGKSRSDWVLFTRKRENYRELVEDKRWEALKVDPRVGVWTDNYSNVLSVFNELPWAVED